MTFTVQGTITLDGKLAKDALKDVGDEAKKAGDGADSFSRKGKGASDTSNKLGGTTKFAAGSVANLTSQYNDLLVTVAAGQNPLTIAIQQGTQITQVFGNAGAAQAGMMLKNALVSMINPLNLITLGAIAGGAALIQWGASALSAGENSEQLIERADRLKEAQAGLTEEIRRQSLGVTAEELLLLDAIAEKSRVIASQQGAQNSRRFADQKALVDSNLKGLEDERSALEAQLATLRALQNQKAALASSSSTLADQERLLGQQMQQTGSELQRNERIAELMRQGINASVIEALELSGIDVAAGLSPAVLEAALLSSELGIALGLAQQIARIGGSGGASGPDQAREQVGNAFGVGVVGQNGVISITQNIGKNNRPKRASRGGGRSGAASASARAAKQEQKAVDDLIASLTRQRDLLRETDPVQKEMIQNREVLAKATDAERETVEKLIATRIAEEAAIERATENAEAFSNTASDALEGLILRGEKGRDVIANLADALAQAVYQSAALGTGPLANLFGGGGSGGLFGMLGNFLFPSAVKKADGGMIYGAGGPREDKVPVLASPGEFFVNAQATATNRGVLEYINAGGKVSGFANGGMLGAAPLSPALTGAAGQSGATGRVIIELLPSPEFDARIVQQSEDVMIQGLSEYRQNSLPTDIEQYSNDPNRVG